MGKYLLDIYNLDVVNDEYIKQVRIENYSGFSYVRKLNAIGSALFSLNILDPVSSPANLKKNKSNMLIMREGVPLMLVTPNKFRGQFEDTGGDLTIEMLDSLSHLNNKLSDKLYQKLQNEYSDTIDELVTDVQARTNGNVRIQLNPTLPTIGNVNETLEYKEIADAIIDQSDNINGFDFDTTPILDANNELDYLQLNLYTNKGDVRNDLPKLKLGDNVKRVEFSTTGDIANYIIALGQGTGGEEPEIIVEDSSSQKTYTRIEKVIKFNDVSSRSKLKLKADEYLKYSKVDRYNLNITLKSESNIAFEQLILGDYLYCDLYKPNTFINFRGWARVVEIRVDVDVNGVETITPKVQFIN